MVKLGGKAVVASLQLGSPSLTKRGQGMPQGSWRARLCQHYAGLSGAASASARCVSRGKRISHFGDQAMLSSPDADLCARGEGELVQDVLDVGRHRALSDYQLFGGSCQLERR
jgi:hypothetical protein